MKKRIINLILAMILSIFQIGCIEEVKTSNSLANVENTPSLSSTSTPDAVPDESFPESHSAQDSSQQDIPKLVVTSICSSDKTAAVIMSDGSLWMWGSNGSGQVGDGSQQDVNHPVKVLDDVIYVSLNEHYSAAIKKDGTLWMWGRNLYGQFGSFEIGNVQLEVMRIQTIPIKVDDDVRFVALGEANCGIVKTDGSLWICGQNYFGQIGNGESSEYEPFTKVLDDVSFIEFGDGNTLAIKCDGSLWTWGNNLSSVLGYGCDGAAGPNTIPMKILEKVDSIKTAGFGAFQSAAAIIHDGTLLVWGGNQFGQLGIGKGGNGLDAWERSAQTVPISILNNIIDIELDRCGDYNDIASLALMDNGDLYAWGHNLFGIVPNNSNEYVFEPTKIMNNVSSIALSNLLGGAVTTDGFLWVWGNHYNSGPIKVAEDVQIIAGFYRKLLVVKNDGTIWCMGQDLELKKFWPDDFSAEKS